MTAPVEAPAGRSLDAILNDLDDHLARIREETYIVLDAARDAKVKPALLKRLKLFEKTVEGFVHKAEARSTEALDISRKVSAILKG